MGRSVRRAVGVMTAAVAVVAGWSPMAPARAAEGSSTVVVHGTDFPASRAASLSFVGCSSLMARTPEAVQSYVGYGPAAPPAGERSQGYDLAGGNAVGSLHFVSSLAATTVASVSVIAPSGTSGVAYVGFQEPAQKGTTLMWFGRAPLSVGAGGWQTVDATSLSYTWSVVDTRTGASLAHDPALGSTGTSAISPFLAGHGGDGPAVFAVGFGCDGSAFSIDRFRIGGPAGVTTYDLEGLATSLSISGSATSIEEGEPVTLTARLRDQSGERVPGAMVVLEARPAGAAAFETEAVLPASGADPSVTLKPKKDTVYRFRFADRPLAEGSQSETYAVRVLQPGEKEPSPEPSQEPRPTEAPSPDAEPSAEPSQESSPEPQPEPSREASAEPEPTREPEPEPSREPEPAPEPEPKQEQEAPAEPVSPQEAPAQEPAAAEPASAESAG